MVYTLLSPGARAGAKGEKTEGWAGTLDSETAICMLLQADIQDESDSIILLSVETSGPDLLQDCPVKLVTI